MIESSEEYRNSVTADDRRVRISALIDLADPDTVMTGAAYDSASEFCKPEQTFNKEFSTTPYATLERNRWVLNGKYETLPDNIEEDEGQMAFRGGVLSGRDGTFAVPVWYEFQFTGETVLQAASVFFGTGEHDGVPQDFVVEIRQNGTVYASKEFVGNKSRSVSLGGFTIYDPDALRVTVSKWSLPSRRLRVAEIVLGIYELWTEKNIIGLTITQKTNFSCLAMPYGTCTLKIDNIDRRFEPRNKTGLFLSIEERQEIPISIGVDIENGSTEYKQLGQFYQHSGGWHTSDNDISVEWDMVDIIGLLADREFMAPTVLPNSVQGWIEALLSQLGDKFSGRHRLDPAYADLPLTVNQGADVHKKKCGDILRWVCMAIGCFARADAQTGHIAVEPYWSQGSEIKLRNLEKYPSMKANDDIAALIFKIYDSTGSELIVSGTSTSSDETIAINNPFIHTRATALTAARMILSTYGGNKIETIGRGDPSSEIGDVDSVQLDESNATTGRRVAQTLSFSGGVLRGCLSELLQADGSFMYQNRVIITKSGTWTAPAGVSLIRAIIVSGGYGGGNGTDGTWDAPGQNGADGAGGRVFAATIPINPLQTFPVAIGKGGEIGREGEETSFGAFSSRNGVLFSSGYTDVANGDVFARTGVAVPIDGTGDGGKGGARGAQGSRKYNEETGRYKVYSEPKPGKPGVPGASGCVVIYYDK